MNMVQQINDAMDDDDDDDDETDEPQSENGTLEDQVNLQEKDQLRYDLLSQFKALGT